MQNQDLLNDDQKQTQSDDNYSDEESNGFTPTPKGGILDNVSITQQTEVLRSFNPQTAVLNHLDQLKNREKEIIIRRYGLIDGEPMTLEMIGTRLNLTRERVRQIEKDSVKKLSKKTFSTVLNDDVDLIFNIIESNGEVVSQDHLLKSLVPENIPSAKQAVLFILNLSPRFVFLKETTDKNPAWCVDGFDVKIIDDFVSEVRDYFQESRKVTKANKLFSTIREKTTNEDIKSLTDNACLSISNISKKIGMNPYEYWGLAKWPEIDPKDVGDKAYLVLKQAKKPCHFEEITDLINKKKFDKKIAHKETVHNELIKDKRFVLVGRGIYALKEWGYDKGTVADVIENILIQAGEPLSKKEIVDRVLGQRLVKKNTIIVGLSNKLKFEKDSDNKYILKQNNSDV